jgi:hypothetical protein
LVGVEQVRLVDDEDDQPAAFGVFGGERVSGLRDQRGLVEARNPAERGDDPVVDAAGADGRVAELDDGVSGGVECGQGGADGDGFAGADLTGDHAEGVLVDAPADPGDGLGVCGVPVQHAGSQVASERRFGEPVEGLQLLDAHFFSSSIMSWMLSWPGVWPSLVRSA